MIDAATLPKWRYILRHKILSLVRIETPPLAAIQRFIRNPVLDSYFAFAANLGTHTFFMVFLPILYWCGYPEFGRALVNLLAAGVIVSGFIKDILCLPRPMSPPLKRITMSGSAALEYGFPSTHSTNAVSVALYAIHVLNSDWGNTLSSSTRQLWIWGFYIYAVSIAFGRLYCGMHGFVDVVCGSALGAFLTSMQIQYGERLYYWTVEGSLFHPIAIMLILFSIVRIHPEPADDCPCFDDSVAFSGVLVGIYWSYWHIIQTHGLLPQLLPLDDQNIAKMPLGVSLSSWKTYLRIPLGVVIIVAYRSITKPMLFKVLPPLFRVMEHLDLDLPRRYFLKASQYRKIPHLRRDDNVLPNPSDVGQMLGDVRRQRGRAVSIGPQSMADAREVLAYRQEAKRRERSPSSSRGQNSIPNKGRNGQSDQHDKVQYETNWSVFQDAIQHEDQRIEDEVDVKESRALFSAIPRIRVRYDVEVITKLIVYAGIAWWAVEGCNAVFELVGLGVG